MSVGPVVSNSSPIIALDSIGQLQLLERLFSKIAVPRAVAAETGAQRTLPEWSESVDSAAVAEKPPRPVNLGAGEWEAILLAKHLSARWILLDERPARKLALAEGLSVIGTLGILLSAKRKGHVDAMRPLLQRLDQQSFRIERSLVERVLHDAGE